MYNPQWIKLNASPASCAMTGSIRTFWVAILVFAAAAAAQDPKQVVEKEARKNLVGVWRGHVVEGKGAKADRGPVKLELTITETTIKGVENKQFGKEGTVDHGVGDFTVDLNATPANLDASQTNTKGRKVQYVGIYSLEGDTLKWCVTRGKTRPTEFATSRGMFLLVLKREKEK
jgi:uncharacterized protein (TIGR03067 family)